MKNIFFPFISFLSLIQYTSRPFHFRHIRFHRSRNRLIGIRRLVRFLTFHDPKPHANPIDPVTLRLKSIERQLKSVISK